MCLFWKICVFLLSEIFEIKPKNISKAMSESIDDKILNSIKKHGRGSVFSTEEYIHYGDPYAVQKVHR